VSPLPALLLTIVRSRAPCAISASISSFGMPAVPKPPIITVAPSGTSAHLRWQAASVRAEAHIGFRQSRELLDRCSAMTPHAFATIVCGDLNAPPDSDIAALFRERGFSDAYASAPQPTCNPHRRATRIDFIFATAGLLATPEPIPAIDADTLLPSAAEPSDHLPITARLALAPTSLS
jgi:endonuclease/exonuclease/phosphatase family metal-dependent hydrolase